MECCQLRNLFLVDNVVPGNIYNITKSLFPTVPDGLVVRIRRSHRRGRGSIPRLGVTFFGLFSDFVLTFFLYLRDVKLIPGWTLDIQHSNVQQAIVSYWTFVILFFWLNKLPVLLFWSTLVINGLDQLRPFQPYLTWPHISHISRDMTLRITPAC